MRKKINFRALRRRRINIYVVYDDEHSKRLENNCVCVVYDEIGDGKL